MEKVLFSKSPDDLSAIVAQIVEDMPAERIFAFYGKMGAGKTTLIKAFCKMLGSRDVVRSPTFSLVNEYEDKAGDSIYHFDFYRIKHIEEVYDIGFEEYIDSGNYCLMEWPERISELLPETYVYVSIVAGADEIRKITYSIQH